MTDSISASQVKPGQHFTHTWRDSVYLMNANLEATLVCDHAGGKCAPKLTLKPDEMVVPLTEDEVKEHERHQGHQQ